MDIIDSTLRDVKLIEPQRFGDSRGWFAEVYNQKTFGEKNLPTTFVQDNQSFSKKGVLRGLHYQLERPQGKLIRVISGHIWDVAVDLRPSSPDFGRWAGFDLKADPLQLLWIPEGFAHGFLVLSETAEVLYKTTDSYYPAGERCILWDDPTLAISWPIKDITLCVSDKDAAGTSFHGADLPPKDLASA